MKIKLSVSFRVVRYTLCGFCFTKSFRFSTRSLNTKVMTYFMLVQFLVIRTVSPTNYHDFRRLSVISVLSLFIHRWFIVSLVESFYLSFSKFLLYFSV